MPTPVIYYVRHGLTDWNAQQRLQGRHDVPLNAEGCAQAVRCGEILRELLLRTSRAPADLDYVSSPLVRARRTMELVRATLGLEPGGYPLDARLVEIAFGDVRLDIANRRVLRAGEAVKLTPVVFRLLAHLAVHPGKVLTHRHLLREVWGPSHVEHGHYLRTRCSSGWTSR